MEWLSRWLSPQQGGSVGKREYGSGSIYERKDGRWVGVVGDSGKAGFTESGARRRVTVTAKTEAEVKRKLRDAQADLRRSLERGQRMTVKAWADEYLKIRIRELSPKGYNAAANPIRKWVVPTIGHRRLEDLTPHDVRAVADVQRRANRQPSDTHRALMTMLRTAVGEGHHVPASVLAVKSPTSDKSDRAAMTVEQGLACLKVAADLPHGSRWLFAMLYGARLGEGLGLTWDAVDLDAGEVRIEWQLQALPYNVGRDRSSGFRVPDGYESQHLVDAFHLVRPKSKSGYRVAPLLPTVRDALLAWRDLAPENPWGLVWPNLKGRPANDKGDRLEWHALQGSARVMHPAGRPFHIHECRNFAATMLLEAKVPEHVVTDLLGHSTVATSLRYRTVRREPLMEAMQRVGERLQLT
jgi:integrase